MVLEYTYFFIAQAIVLWVYYVIDGKKDTFELNKFFRSKTHFLTMNTAVIVTCCYFNIRRQLFCIPVPWTLLILGLFCICFLALPFANKNSKIFPFISFFSGLGFFIALYILFFGGFAYLIFTAFNLIIAFGLFFPLIWLLKKRFDKNYLNALWYYVLFVFAPFFLIWQLLLLLKTLNTRFHKTLYISSSFVVLIISLVFVYQMNFIFKKVASSKNVESELQTLNKNPVNNYLTELILGAHWKYHTEFCEYDGWRPPFHDPVLVISNKVLFPYQHFAKGTTLYYNLDLYKKLYPDNPTKFNCRCGMKERIFSFSDDDW